MNRFPVLAFVLFVVVGVAWSAFLLADDARRTPGTPYALPDDPKAQVIVFNFKGGFTPPRKNNDPTLQILADGTMILGAPFGTLKRLEHKITQGQLQKLLAFMLQEPQCR